MPESIYQSKIGELPQEQPNNMEKDKMFFKTIELAANELQKDKFETYRIQQEAKKKKIVFVLIISAIIGLAFLLLFLS